MILSSPPPAPLPPTLMPVDGCNPVTSPVNAAAALAAEAAAAAATAAAAAGDMVDEGMLVSTLSTGREMGALSTRGERGMPLRLLCRGAGRPT